MQRTNKRKNTDAKNKDRHITHRKQTHAKTKKTDKIQATNYMHANSLCVVTDIRVFISSCTPCTCRCIKRSLLLWIIRSYMCKHIDTRYREASRLGNGGR